jgi:hypothetical protein
MPDKRAWAAKSEMEKILRKVYGSMRVSGAGLPGAGA